MADIETLQSKLRSTPTAGVAGEHSPYYRRLLSAGYKGYIQGSIGGATLYGTLGLAVGALVGIPLALATGGAALLLIPAMGGLGFIHGAHTFADIGKTAAIIAESADLNEKRRYLLDRYYETPDDKEAEAIRKIIEDEHKPKTPEKMFHWRTVFVGAALGLVIAAGIVGLAHFGVALPFLEPILGFLHAPVAAGGLGLAAVKIGAVMGAIGAAGGALIGLDREYIRRWLDKSETLVNDPSRAEHELALREREIQRLSEINPKYRFPHPDIISSSAPATLPATADPIANGAIAPLPALTNDGAREPISPRVIAGLDHPDTKITSAQLQDRAAKMQAALQQ